MFYYVELHAHALFGAWRATLALSQQIGPCNWDVAVARNIDGLPVVEDQTPDEALRALLERLSQRV